MGKPILPPSEIAKAGVPVKTAASGVSSGLSTRDWENVVHSGAKVNAPAHARALGRGEDNGTKKYNDRGADKMPERNVISGGKARVSKGFGRFKIAGMNTGPTDGKEKSTVASKFVGPRKPDDAMYRHEKVLSPDEKRDAEKLKTFGGHIDPPKRRPEPDPAEEKPAPGRVWKTNNSVHHDQYRGKTTLSAARAGYTAANKPAKGPVKVNFEYEPEGNELFTEDELARLDEISKGLASRAADGLGKKADDAWERAQNGSVDRFVKNSKLTSKYAKAEDTARAKVAGTARVPATESFDLDEAKRGKRVPSATTPTSSPLKGANQDQSGVGVTHDTSDYTISDGYLPERAAIFEVITAAHIKPVQQPAPTVIASKNGPKDAQKMQKAAVKVDTAQPTTEETRVEDKGLFSEEELARLDEISQKKTGNYIKKALENTPIQGQNGHNEKRSMGVNRAINKLSGYARVPAQGQSLDDIAWYGKKDKKTNEELDPMDQLLDAIKGLEDKQILPAEPDDARATLLASWQTKRKSL